MHSSIVIYYREGKEVKHKSINIISNNLSHDTAAVYEYQKIMLDYVKANHIVRKNLYHRRCRNIFKKRKFCQPSIL